MSRTAGRIAFLAVATALGSGSLAGQDVELGQRLFREGISARGDALAARINGDVTLTGGFVACAKCHRRSGWGSREGARLVPPVTAPALFREQVPRRIEWFGNLFHEPHPDTTRAQVHFQATRPAYSESTLTRLLETGVDAAGRPLDPLMPRYELGEEDRQNLLAYLKTLGTRDSPGVDETAIHFGVVVSAWVPPARRQAMLDVLEMYVHCHNREVDRFLQHTRFSANYRHDFLPTYRKWVLHIWTLRGEPASWHQQLDDYYRRSPVFALLSGIAGRPWDPVHHFCADRGLPGVFPNTRLPAIRPDHENQTTLYFNRGLVGEAETLAARLAESRPRTVVQVFRDSGEVEKAVDTLEQHLAGQQAGKDAAAEISRIRLPRRGSLTAGHARQLLQANPDQVVVWLEEDDARALAGWLSELARDDTTGGPLEHPSFFFSGTLLASAIHDPWPARSLAGGAADTAVEWEIDWNLAGSDKLFVCWPYARHSDPSPELFRVRRWLNSRRILAPGHERVQLNTWYACNLTRHALAHMVDHYDRDYFMEWLEHEAQDAANPGVYRRLALAPGQRYASRQMAILRLCPSPAVSKR